MGHQGQRLLESLIKKSQWACLSVPGRDTFRTNLLAPAEARQHGEVLGMTPLYSGKQKLQPHTRGQAASYLAGADPDCLQAAPLASGTTSSTCCLRKYLTGTAEIVAFQLGTSPGLPLGSLPLLTLLKGANKGVWFVKRCSFSLCLPKCKARKGEVRVKAW